MDVFRSGSYAPSTDDVVVEYGSADIWRTTLPVEWKVQTILARGGLEEIKLAMLGERNRMVAIKTCDTNKESRRESELLIECQSDFVVELSACLVHAGKRYLCMSYYELGDLWKWMQKDFQRNFFKEAEAIWIVSFILAAVQYIYQKRILHLDIKPGNILLDDNGYPLLADFGASLRFSDRSSGGHALTPAYDSPEMRACEMPDRLDDLWSTACTFFEIIEGELPSHGRKQVDIHNVKGTLGISPNVPKMSPMAQDFVECQIRPMKQQRLGFKTGASADMKHPVFGSVNWPDIKYCPRVKKSPILFIIKELKEADEKRGIRRETVRVTDINRNSDQWELASVFSNDGEFKIPVRRWPKPEGKMTVSGQDDID